MAVTNPVFTTDVITRRCPVRKVGEGDAEYFGRLGCLYGLPSEVIREVLTHVDPRPDSLVRFEHG